MKKYNFTLCLAAFSASVFGLFLALIPDFVNASAALRASYGSLFNFGAAHSILNTILFLYGLLAAIALIVLCVLKKSYGNIMSGMVVFVSVFLLLPHCKGLTDGLPLMGTAMAGCVFAFIGLIVGQLVGILTVLELFGVQVLRFEEVPGKFSQKKPLFKGLVTGGVCLGIVVVGALLSVGAGFVGGATCSHEVASHVDVTEAKKAYFTEGRGTYDLKGDAFTLRGVNFGNYLIQEGWLSPTGLGPAKNADGSYVKVNEEGIVEEYNEVYQEELIAALENNPNLTEAQIESLWNAYYMSYAQNEDFENIKKLGLNGIRLPMDYRIFVEGEAGNLTLKDNAFYYVDRFLKMAKANGLVVVLDMHGVEGGQSGYEHSGTRKCEFWDNETYQKDMAELWQKIALHYRDDEPGLFSTIFAFDLVNEPTPRNQAGTLKKQWDAMDKLYQAIREVDEDHIVMFEGVWEFSNLPNHTAYGWKNVVYEFHFYNWNSGTISNDLYWNAMTMALSKSDTSVPYYIGEFTFFDNEASWAKMLKQFDEWNYSWTFWTYKMACVGWWDNSWGVYLDKMNLKNEVLKVDLRTATFDEIYAVWAHQGTSETYNETGVMYKVLKAYQESRS